MQGAFRDHIAVLDGLGADAFPLREASELESADGLVLPGGESTTMDKLLRHFDLQAPLRERLEGGLPALATCAGVILLARDVRDGLPDQESLGVLPLAVRRNAYGRQPESFEADVDFDFLDAPFAGIFIRSPVIEDTGEGVEVLARLDGRPVAVGYGPHLALTFHPELTRDPRLHAHFLERVEMARAGASGEATG
jgi:5'-phosphate synthase pdxT subunit